MKFFHCGSLEIASILPFHNPYIAVYIMLRNMVSLCRPSYFSFFVAGIEESYHEIGRLGFFQSFGLSPKASTPRA